MKGYHYTTSHNWKKIKSLGKIIPSKLNFDNEMECVGDEINRVFSPVDSGVWIWKELPKGEQHLFSLLKRLNDKGSTKIVLLEIEYEQDEVKKGKNGERLSFDIVESIGAWKVSHGDNADILTKDVPISRIKLLAEYDLVDLLAPKGVAEIPCKIIALKTVIKAIKKDFGANCLGHSKLQNLGFTGKR